MNTTLRVLLVEDNDDHAELIRRQLTLLTAPRVQVTWKQTLESGLQELEALKFDAVFLDLRLPDSDHEQTLDRAVAAAPDLPIIVLTSLGDVESGSTAVQKGAQDFLVKTACSADLLSRALCYSIERKKLDLEMQRYADELERSNRELDQFARIVAHDLKSPLAVVQMDLRQLDEKLGGDTESAKIVQAAVQSVETMSELVDNLLQLSRVRHEPQQFSQVDCEEVVNDVLTMLRGQIEAAGARVTRDILPTVTGDETRLMQVFQNLVSNAIRYGRENPEIHISAEFLDSEWIFSVEDNGIGIPEDACERIFEMFERCNPEKADGTGIGLAICRRVVAAHGGRIWVTNNATSGCTFYFSLPAAASATPSPDRPDAALA